jgi:hypothetical protein
MRSKFLLPHQFKWIGYIIAPLGIILWSIIQKGHFLQHFLNLKALILTISACMFVFGFFFTVFAREKIEDEYISLIRLETFQLASIIQCFLIIIGFFLIGFAKIPMRIDSQMLYYIGCIFFYYLFYIVRFRYTIQRTNKLKG